MYAPAEKGQRDELEGPLVELAFKVIHGKVSRGETVDSNWFHTAMINGLNDWVVTQESRASGNSKDYIKRKVAEGAYAPVIGSTVGTDIIEDTIDNAGKQHRGEEEADKIRVLIDVGYETIMKEFRRQIYLLKRNDKKAAALLHGKGGRRTSDGEILEIAQTWLPPEALNKVLEGLDPFKLPGAITPVDIKKHQAEMAKAKQRKITARPKPVHATKADFRSAKQIIKDLLFPTKAEASIVYPDMTKEEKAKAELIGRELDVAIEKRHIAGYIITPQALAKSDFYKKELSTQGVLPRMYEDQETAERAADALNADVHDEVGNLKKQPVPILDISYHVERHGDKWYVAKTIYTERKSNWTPDKQVDPHITKLLRDKYTMSTTEVADAVVGPMNKKINWLRNANGEMEIWVKTHPLHTGIEWQKVRMGPDNAKNIAEAEELEKLMLARHAAIATSMSEASMKTVVPKAERGITALTPQSDNWMLDPAWVEFAWRNPKETTVTQPRHASVKYLSELAKLKLPKNLMVITTSASMAAQGVGDAKANNDIDVIVSNQLVEKLDALVKDKKLEKKPGKNGGSVWATPDGHIEFIPAGQMHLPIEFKEVLKKATRSKRTKQPFFFENLTDIVKRKEAMGRDKDKKHVKQITDALYGKPRPLNVGGDSRLNDDLIAQMYTKAEMSQPEGVTKRVKDRKTKVFAERGIDARVIEEPGAIEVTVGDLTKAYMTLSTEALRDLHVDIYENMDAAEFDSIERMMENENERWDHYNEVRARADAGKTISAKDAVMLENYEKAKRNAAIAKQRQRDPYRKQQHKALLDALAAGKTAEEARAAAKAVPKPEAKKPQPKALKAMTPEERIAFLGKTEPGRAMLAKGRQAQIEEEMGDQRIKTEELTEETKRRLAQLTEQAQELRGKAGRVDVDKMPEGWHMFRFVPPKYVEGDVRRGQTLKVVEYAGPTPEMIYVNLTGKRQQQVDRGEFQEFIKTDKGKLSKLSFAKDTREEAGKKFQFQPAEKKAELAQATKLVKKVQKKKEPVKKEKKDRKKFKFGESPKPKQAAAVEPEVKKIKREESRPSEDIAKDMQKQIDEIEDPEVRTAVQAEMDKQMATPLVEEPAPEMSVDNVTDEQKEAQIRIEEALERKTGKTPTQGDIDKSVSAILNGTEDLVNFTDDDIKATFYAYSDDVIILPNGEDILTPNLGSLEDMSIYEDALFNDDVSDTDKATIEQWMEESEDNLVQIEKVLDEKIDDLAGEDIPKQGFNPLKGQKGGAEVEIPSAREQLGKMAKWMKGFGKQSKKNFDSTAAWADVAASFKFEDKFAEETAFHAKNTYSFREAKVDEFERKVLTPFAEIVRRTFPNATKAQMAQMVFAAEDTQVEADMKRKAKVQVDTGRTTENLYDKHFAEGVTFLRSFFAQARKWYADHGMPVDFINNEIARQEARWFEAVDNNDASNPEAVAKNFKKAVHAMKRIADLQGKHFIHLPSTFWTGTEIDKLLPKGMKDKTFKAKRAALRAMLKKRRAVSIGDLVRKGLMSSDKVNPMEILMHYGSEMAYNESLFNIRDAAIKDGLIKNRLTKPKGEGWAKPLPNMKGLVQRKRDDKGRVLTTWIRADAAHALDAALAADTPRNWWQQLNTGYKLLRFYNPLFLPLYDVFQSVGLAGALGKHTPESIIGAIRSSWSHDEHWQAAAENGLFSKPFSSRIGERARQARQISTSPHRSVRAVQNITNRVSLEVADVVSALHEYKPGKAAWRAGKALVSPVMQLSWDVAWGLDQTIRLYTYHYLKARGMNTRDAAQTAALAHGDYASVPAKTRRQLNNFFFTPTFKIAMAKAHGAMIKGAIQTAVDPKEWGRSGRAGKKRAMARAALMFIAINAGFELLFRAGLDWDEEEIGRKYSREVMTDDGLLTQVISWSTPLNLGWKFMKRFYSLVEDDPTGVDPWKKFINSMAYEAIPVVTTVRQAWNNRDIEGGRIRWANDSQKKQYWDTFKFVTGQIVPLIPKVADLAGGDVSSSRKHRISKELLQDDWSKPVEFLSRFFLFHYLKAHPDQALERDLQGLDRRFTEEVNEQLLEHGDFPEDWYDRFYDRQEQRIEEYFESQ
jgi:hypothetical protein